MALLIIPAFPSALTISNPEVNNDGGPITILAPILDYTPKSRNFGALQSGVIKITTFEISNKAIDQDISDNIYYEDLYWEIIVPELFSRCLSITPSNGICNAAYQNLTAWYENGKIGDPPIVYDNKTVTVTLNTTGLSIGSYRIEVIINALRPDVEDGVFTIDFSIGAVLKISSTKATVQLGKPDTGFTTFQIWNGGFDTLNYSLDWSCYQIRYIPYTTSHIKIREDMNSNWISISPISGNSAGKYDKDTIQVTINTSTLKELPANTPYYDGIYYPFIPGGLYECDINITSNGVINDGQAIFNLAVIVKPQLEYGNGSNLQKSIGLGELFRGDINNTSFEIYNKVPGHLIWNISIPTCFEDYLTVTPMSGTSDGPWDKTIVTATIDAAKKYQGYGGIKPRSDLFISKSDLYAARPGPHHDFINIYTNEPGRGVLSNNAYNFNFDYYLSLCSKEQHYDMLIITTDFLLNYGPLSTYDYVSNNPWCNLSDLKKAHETIDGYNVKTVTVEEIYKDYLDASTFYSYKIGRSDIVLVYSTGIRSNNLAIREFIKDAYKHWGVKYVLLVGDDNWEMEEKEFDIYDHRHEHPWNVYYKNLETKWLKTENIEDLDTGGICWGVPPSRSVEVPTFQVSTGGVTSSESGESGDGNYTWEKWFIPLKDCGTSVDVSIGTTYPVKDSDGNPRDLYIKNIEAYDSSQILYVDGFYVVDENLEFCDVVNFGGTTGSYSENEMAHSASGWNLSTSSYMGSNCRSINYKDQGFGGRATLTSSDPSENILGIVVEFYDHYTAGYDTFIVKVNGVEVARNSDDLGPSYIGGDPYTVASDLPYAFLDTEKVEIERYLSKEANVYVGRAPVSSLEELSNFVYKTITYMKAPDKDYLKAVIASEFLGLKAVIKGGDSDDYYGVSLSHDVCCGIFKNQTIDVSTEGGYKTRGVPSTIFNITLLEDIVTSFNLDDNDYVWYYPNILDKINSGVGIINHMGHGDKSTSRRMIGFDAHSFPIWSNVTWYSDMRLNPFFINIIEPKPMTNMIYPIVFSTGCYGGQFDAKGGQMCEWLTSDKNGAVAGIWISDAMPWSEDASALYDRMFWDTLFGGQDDRTPILGDAFYKSKQKAYTTTEIIPMLPNGGTAINDLISSSKNSLYYSLNLFGDPALKVKGAENRVPVADIQSNYRDEPILVNTGIRFSTTDSYDIDGEIVSYYWDFGDETTATNDTLEHVFAKVGKHFVTLTVKDNNGAAGTDQLYIQVVNPDNEPPVISMENPADDSIDVPVDLSSLSVLIKDPEGDSFDCYIAVEDRDIADGKIAVQNDHDGVKSLILSEDLEYNTTYSWKAGAVDHGSGYTTEIVFTFTTEENVNSYDGYDDNNTDEVNESDNISPIISLANPGNNSEYVFIDIDDLSVSIVDPDSDSFSWSIETSPNIGSVSGSSQVNGTKTCSISNLQYDTTYIWFVNATDLGSGNTTYSYFVFTTQSNDSEDNDDDDDESPIDAVNVTVEVIKPVDSGLYIFNKFKREMFMNFILGEIDIAVNVSGENLSCVAKICFFLDDVLLENISFDESKREYNYTLDKRRVGLCTLSVKLFDSEGVVLASDEVDAFIVNFNIF